MSVKIRLQRHGKKGKPFYWIVAADARVKRDGKFLEKLGTYNPITNPATIELNVDNAVKWLENGAQPTDTARAILSYKGALYKKHLAGGVKKGALTEEQAEEKFQAWLQEKEAKVQSKADGIAKSKAEAKAEALKAEKATNEARKAAAAPAPAEAPSKAKAEEVVAEEKPQTIDEAFAAANEAPVKEAEVAVEEAASEPEAKAEEATAEPEAPAEEDSKEEA